jgi:hypothetical protein
MSMFDIERDYAACIVLTDDRDRTLLKFIKEKPDSDWCVSGLRRRRNSVPRRTRALKWRQRDLPPHRVKRLPDGRERLDVPGPLLPWDERTRTALDRLHASGKIMRLTVGQLRAATAYIK